MKTTNQKNISIDECLKMFERASKEANNQGIKIAFCVVDAGGNIKHFSRMDGAPLIATDISRKKAITAIGFGISTGDQWFNFIKDDPILREGAGNIEDFILLGGGMPIKDGDDTVGAIGVSGGHYKQDEACCLKALNF